MSRIERILTADVAEAARSAYHRAITEEPAHLLGAVAAGLTAVASILKVGDVHTWQAVLPVLLAAAIRRLVNSPATVSEVIELLLDDDHDKDVAVRR